MSKPRVFVDIMGGDEPPEEQIKGVLEAHKRLGSACIITAVGRDIYEPLFKGKGVDLRVVDGVVFMNGDPMRATEKEPTTSVGLAVKLAAGQDNAAAVSCGNTGAAVAAARTHMRALVSGPYCPAALMSVLPTYAGGKMIALDLGANPDFKKQKPYHYLDMALMGRVYASHFNPGLVNPSVGLLANGTEPHKGTKSLRTALELFTAYLPDFPGQFAEGNCFMTDQLDVLVGDGFTLNVALKVAESAIKGMGQLTLEGLLRSAPLGVGTAWIERAYPQIMSPLDWRNNNGALLAGINGNVIAGHGCSDWIAVAHAVEVAASCASRNVLGQFRQSLQEVRDSGLYQGVDWSEDE